MIFNGEKNAQPSRSFLKMPIIYLASLCCSSIPKAKFLRKKVEFLPPFQFHLPPSTLDLFWARFFVPRLDRKIQTVSILHWIGFFIIVQQNRSSSFPWSVYFSSWFVVCSSRKHHFVPCTKENCSFRRVEHSEGCSISKKINIIFWRVYVLTYFLFYFPLLNDFSQNINGIK